MATEAISALAPEPVVGPEHAHAPTNAANDQTMSDQATCAKSTFPHSPPASNDVAKSEGSESELSDLDDDTFDPKPAQDEPKEDIGEVLPDHWSGNVPVFRPSMHQFKDFQLFMQKIDSYGMKSGIVKVIPPQEWKDAQPKLDELVKHVRVRDPIKQEIMGSGGTYRQVNVLHGRSYNVPAWRNLCDQSEHQPPARRGERRLAAPKTKTAPKPRAPAAPKSTSTSAKKRGGKRGRGRKKAKQEPDDEAEERPMTPVSPKPSGQDPVKSEDVAETIEGAQGLEADEDEDATPAVGRMGGARPARSKAQTVSSRRKNARRQGSAKIDEEAFRDFDYNMDISDYTPERCEELERIYWKTLTYAPPLYGADMMGTLFDDSTPSWNLNKLPNLLDVLGTKVPGVNTAYLYLGMWKATFAWHLEDVDLYSINYLHFGAPKQWYSISQADAPRFEAAMRSTWPNDAKACSQFLRHKGYLISPQHLKSHYNITVNKCVSYPGEFVVTYPYGYHSGYNLGYNCAEAVNFALDSWLPMGKLAKRCECAQAQDSVWIDVYDIERRLRGEETEYEETEDEEDEEEDEDMEDASGLPSPPSSHSVKVKIPARKRKRDPKDKADKKKKVKKIKLRVKARAEPPCCLCPNEIPGCDVLPTAEGRKAHRMCALYLPETYIDNVDGKEVVVNADKISKERLNLKCLFCRSKRGACFQCSQKKCARAYHATCAAAAGVFVEEAEVPVFGEDGTEYKEQAFEFSCRFHRTKRDKKLDGIALEDDERITKTAEALREGEICQLQFFRGDIFAGVVVENRRSEQTLLLDIIPNGDRVEVEWKWLLVPDPSDYHLPKASHKAIPMPSSRKAKDELNAKRAEDEVPRKGDPFVDGGFSWAEFNTGVFEDNKDQARLDLSKDNQVWYYLGAPSTEAKPQYTESPALPRHNPRSNFLNTLPKPAKPPKPAKAVATSVNGQGRQSYVPQRPSPLSAGATGMQTTSTNAKAEKPYVYKPRKPIQATWSSSSQHFTPKLSPGVPQTYPDGGFNNQFSGGQHSSSGQNLQGGQLYTSQTFAPSYSPDTTPQYGSQYSASASSPSSALASQQAWRTPSATHYQLSTQPQSSSQPFMQQPNGNQAKSQQAQKLSSHAKAPTTTSAHQPSHAQNHAHGQSKYSQAAATSSQQSVYQKYPFFQVNHNRGSNSYLTPYDPWGGFINGYQGNFKAHMQQTSSLTTNLPHYDRPAFTDQAASPSQLGFGSSWAINYANLSACSSSGPSQLRNANPEPPAYTKPGTTSNPAQWDSVPHTGSTIGYTHQATTGAPHQSANVPTWSSHVTATPQQRGSAMNGTTPTVAVQPGSSVSGNAHTSGSPSTGASATSFGPQSYSPATPTFSTQQVKNEGKVASSTASKPSAPKVQYKIPEKQTPVPLPPMYLAAKKRISTPSKTPTAPMPSSSNHTTTSPQTVSEATHCAAQDPDPGSVSGAPSPSPNSDSTPTPPKAVLKSETPVPIPLPKTSHSAQQSHGQGQIHPQTGSPTSSQFVPTSTELTPAPATSTSPSKVTSDPSKPSSPIHTDVKSGSLPAVQDPSHSATNFIQLREPPTETPVPLPPIPGRLAQGTTPRATSTVQSPRASASQTAFHASSDGTSGTVGFPDVPQDSMALIEQMMSSLKRASSTTATAG